MIGLLLTSLGLGLRHGLDWDHIAAIADLSSTAESRRRGFVLSVIYAVAHAVVVFVLGVLAIALSATLPDGLAEWMGRVVGITLLALGVWVLIELVRKGRDFRLRSRWMLVLTGTFAGFRRVRRAATGRTIEVDHQHEHEHGESQGHSTLQAHDHAHVASHNHVEVDADVAQATPVGAGAGGNESRRRWYSGHRHAHRHQHALALPDDPFARYEGRTAAGIGMLHGVGVESPTQIAVFVAATTMAGLDRALLLLLAWCVGLILSNALIALLAGFGLLSAERNFRLYAAVATLVAIGSIVMGVAMIGGYDFLPEL